MVLEDDRPDVLFGVDSFGFSPCGASGLTSTQTDPPGFAEATLRALAFVSAEGTEEVAGHVQNSSSAL